MSYPTTTPCTPTATSRSTRPGQAASARLSGPGSLTVALPTPWSRPIGRRNGTTPRLGVFAALAGLSLSGVWGRRRRPPAPPATRWSGLRWQRLLAQGCLDGRRVPDRRRVDDLEDLDVITEAAAQAHRRPAATGRHRPWSSYAVSRSRGLGLIQRGGGFVAGRCRPRARRRRRCRVVGSRRSGGRQEQHGVSILTPSAWPRAWPGEPRRCGDRPRTSAPPTRGGATTAAAPAWQDWLVVARAGHHRDNRADRDHRV